MREIVSLSHVQARLPAPRAGGARFLLRAHYIHFCTKIINSLERAGGAAAPLPPSSVGVPAHVFLSKTVV